MKPIYIKGVGCVGALPANGAEHASALFGAQSGIVSREFRGEEFPVGAIGLNDEHFVEEIRNSNTRYANLDRVVILAMLSARRALKQAKWSELGDALINLGTSRGATELFERYIAEYLSRKEWRRGSPLVSPTTTLGNISSWVAQDLGGFEGSSFSHASTCTSAAQALANAQAWLRSGMCARALVGGSEAPLTPFTLSAMASLRIYAREQVAGYHCRPFSADGKNSFVLGEGAACFALDSESEGALARLSGVGLATERIETATGIDPQGDGFKMAIERALSAAGGPTIDLIFAHAPGTPQGDAAELAALRALFGKELPHITSNKWLYGHCLGASAALSVHSALSSLGASRYPILPYPTHFASPTPRQHVIRNILINSAGFGGNFGSIIISALS